MAGIKASSASKVMADGDVAVTDVETGYLTGEQIALATLPSASSYAWVVAKPSSSTVRASLSLATSATPTFTPDVAGEYVFVCVVDGLTSYVLRTSVTAVAQTTALESIRYQPLTDVRVPAPPSGGAVYYSSDLNALAIKDSGGIVSQVGGSDYHKTFKNTTTSAIAANVTAGTANAVRRYRITGTLVVDQILTLPSFVDIDATGANITTTLAPAVGLADDWTNTLFKAASVSTATTTTVVADGASAAAYPGATRIAVASSAGFAAGDWIRVYSYNAASRPNPYFTGEDVPVYRIYKVASVASGILNIVGVIRYWHANYVSAFSGSTVTKITLTEGINWRGGRFDCSGGSIANAFSFDGVLNGSVNGATFKGFSRACVELLRGSKNFAVNEFAHEGEINAGIYGQQCEQVQIDDFKSPAFASATKHTNGIPRALITLRRRASHIQITNAHFGWGTIGLQMWGVDNVNAVNLNVENMNGNNRPASIDGQLSTRCGIAIDGGQASVTTSYLNGVDGIGAVDGAPFSFNVNIENVVVSECLGDSASQCYVYFHDTISQKITNLSIAHLGNGDGTGGPAIKPIICSDGPGSYLKNVHTNGTYGCIYTENGGLNHGTIDGVYHQAACGVGYSNGPLFGLNHGGGGGQLTIRNVKISNGGRHWEFDTQFTDWNMQVENFQADVWNQPADLLICVVNAGARPAEEGRVMQLTGALGGASSKFPIVGVAATGAVTKCVATATGGGTVFETGTNGGYGFVQVVQPGKRSNVQCANTVGTGPALTQGDFVRHSAAGDGGLTFARGDNAVTFDKAIGKVYGAIPAVGATGLVKLI